MNSLSMCIVTYFLTILISIFISFVIKIIVFFIYKDSSNIDEEREISISYSLRKENK